MASDLGAPSCDVCKDLEAYSLRISMTQLSESVKRGCEPCQLLQRGIHHFVPDVDKIKQLEIFVDSALFLTLRDHGNEAIGTVELYSLPGKPVVWPKIGPARHVSADSSSDECVMLAKKWLSGCIASHEHCRRSWVPTLPTRVIQVGTTQAETKLRITRRGERGEYAALSHCWGGSDPITTTSATLEQRKSQLSFGPSSRTFGDAVDFTRRLGIPYLWIDSLCIIQDSNEDWAAEAARMSQVYNSATVTISAASATDSSSGLFPQQDERRTRNISVEIPCRGPDGTMTGAYARFRHGDALSTDKSVHSSKPVGATKLQSRGWVLQEDLLSPRMLHFTNEELSWTCATFARCECKIRPTLPFPNPYRAGLGAKRKESNNTSLCAMLNLQWPHLVMDFTRRQLTHESDRMPALAGLAGWTEQQTDDQYMAGLWMKDGEYQLLWYRDKSDEISRPPTRFTHPYAPSWSWASISGPISYDRRWPIEQDSLSHHPATGSDSVQPLFKLCGHWEILNGLNIYGPVQHATLYLLSMVLPVTFDVERGLWCPDRPMQDLDPGGLKVNIDVPSEMPAAWDDVTARSYVFILAARRRGRGMTIVSMQAVCLLARRMTRADDMPLLEQSVKQGLDVRPDNAFQRVGMVRGAGSIDCWEKAADLLGLIYLL
ncbi:Heterokaryon incompatibility protein (HET) domain containing protein [Naviculisporaceae sp. PSN 640]